MSDDVRLTLRVPKDLHDRLVQLAKDERRSLNNLLTVLLERGVEQAGLDKKH